MIEHTQYKFSRIIRKYSFRTITSILSAVAEPMNVTLFKNMFPMFIQLLEKANTAMDIKEIKLILKSLFLNCKVLNEENKEHKNYMDEQMMNVLGPLMGASLEAVK